MSDDVIDIRALGVEPSYTKKQQERLRRYLLEDWKASGQKLYTYCNLLTLQLSRQLPVKWLSKIIPQTMRKMLFDAHMPRYEFWACVHAYLKHQYPEQINIHAHADVTQERLGHALSLFLNVTDDNENGGYYAFEEGALRLEKQRDQDFYGLVAFKKVIGKDTYLVKSLLGVAISQPHEITGICRDIVTFEPEPISIQWQSLEPLTDSAARERLDLIGEAS